MDPTEHRGLVAAIALKVARSSRQRVEVDDLIGYGQLGLLRACEVFNPSRGLKFSTCAKHWIYGAIQAGLERESWPMRFPRYVEEALSRERRGRALSDCERKAIGLARAVMGREVWGGDALRRVAAHAPAAPPPDPVLVAAALRALESLRSGSRVELRRALAIRLRVGLDGPPQTYEEIGRRLGVGRNQARVIEQAGLEQLRGMLAGRGRRKPR